MCAWGSRWLVIAAMMLPAVLGGCGREPTTTYPRRFGQQVLAGLVYAETGEPVAGANVRVTGVLDGGTSRTISVGGCFGANWFVDSALTTSSKGTFTKTIGFAPGGLTLCVAVEVSPASGSALRSGLAWVPEMRATSSTDVPDTTRVVLVLTRN